MPDWIQSSSDSKLHQAVALLLLAVAITVRWSAYLLSPESLGDENIYLQAFAAIDKGLSPTEIGGFYYPETFARLGAWILGLSGATATRAILRVFSVLGLAITVWIALCFWPAPWIRRLGVSIAYVTVAPAVYYGVETGNISLAVNGAILLALATWWSRPLLAGALLGASTAIKPLAPLAITALFFHRPIPATRRNLIAGMVAGVLALGFLSMNPSYLATSPQAIGRLPFIRSISLNRVLVLMGVEVSPLVLAAVLGAVIILVARLVPMSRRTILSFAGCAAVIAVPIIWSHTLLLTLPLQVLALNRALTRRREREAVAPRSPGGRRELTDRYEVIFVILAIAALQMTNGIGAIDDQALSLQLIVLTGVYLSAPALLAYVLTTERGSD